MFPGLTTFMAIHTYQGLIMKQPVVQKTKEGMIFVTSVMRKVFKQQQVLKVNFITSKDLRESAFNIEKNVCCCAAINSPL